jgi:hypothetical protein
MEVVITSADDRSPFALLVAGMHLLLKDFDPQDHEETAGNYAILYEALLRPIGQHMLDYAHISHQEREHTSIRDMLLGSIEYMDFSDDIP